MKRILACAATAALLTGCMSMDRDSAAATGSGARLMAADTARAPAPMPTNAVGYMKMAAASDMFEIESSQLALQKAGSADIRAFAQMMVDHHTRTSADLMAAARAGGLTPPSPMLPPDKRAKIEALNGASRGQAFDRMYMDMQVMAHQEALALHSTYAARGDNPSLKAAAAKTAPIVQSHLDRAHALHHGGGA
ncbi:MAG TPA: DUF4142 domain-containing protein [Caulobacteraceae bacterium]|nr:DUF4142 domain-containing protein [Caulobacteraceae bacterium]